jgi:hypothetical protein
MQNSTVAVVRHQERKKWLRKISGSLFLWRVEKSFERLRKNIEKGLKGYVEAFFFYQILLGPDWFA